MSDLEEIYDFQEIMVEYICRLIKLQMYIIRYMIYLDQEEVTQVMNELTYKHFIEDKAILLGKLLQVYVEIHLWMRVYWNLEIYYLK